MSFDRSKPLRRNSTEGKIAGVCAGIAEYVGVDVSVVRAVTVALLLFGPGVIVIYAVLWWLLDDVATDPNRFQADAPTAPTEHTDAIDLDLRDTTISDPEDAPSRDRRP